MNEKQIENGLKQIASEQISEQRTVWPQVQARLAPQNARSARFPRWAFAALVLIGLGALVAVVPPVRAGLVELVETIGGVDFTLSADYPGAGEEPTIVPSENIPLEEALAAYPISYPAWAPAGFVLDPEARLTWFDERAERPYIELTWRAGEGGIITLAVHPQAGLIVGLTEIEVLEIKGQEVALWRGGWNYDTQSWDEKIPVQTLSWSLDGLDYRLQAPLSFPQEDLVQMAASCLP